MIAGRDVPRPPGRARRAVVGAVAVLVVSAGLGSVAGAAGEQARAVGPDRYVETVVAATDEARTTNRLRHLRPGACLERSARSQAARMARQGRISHSPDLRAIGRRCGLGALGENVAQARGGDRGRGVVRMWMRSSGHRDNILNPGYRLLGAGAVHARGSWWVVQLFGRKT